MQEARRVAYEELSSYLHKEGKREDLFATREICFVVTQDMHKQFARLSGDFNPIHDRGIVHGAHIIAKISAAIGTQFPGPKTVLRRIENVEFLHPVKVGEQVFVHIRMIDLIDNREARLEVRAETDGDKRYTVLNGQVVVRLPAALRNQLK